MNEQQPAGETPWQTVGRYIRLRRERLDLKQADLKARLGPGSSTVRKAELATFEDGIPQGTQHALEKALGWTRGTIREAHRIVSTDDWWAEDEFMRGDYENTLIEEYIPDLSDTPATNASPRATSAAELTDEELLAELTFRMRRYGLEAAAVAEPATVGEIPPVARHAFHEPADFELAAHSEERDVDDEVPHTT